LIGNAKPPLEVLEVLVDGLAVAGVSLLGETSYPLRGVHDRLVEVDHRGQLRHRGGEVDEPCGGAAGAVAAAELVPLAALPDQLVVLRVERHQHTLDRTIELHEQVIPHSRPTAIMITPPHNSGLPRQRSVTTSDGATPGPEPVLPAQLPISARR